MAWIRPHKQRHVLLSVREEEHLQSILSRRGITFTAWLRSAINREAAEHIPEAATNIRRIIPTSVAVLSSEVLSERGNWLWERSRQERDPERRKMLQQEARSFLDAASFFDWVESDRQYRQAIGNQGEGGKSSSPNQRLKPVVNPTVAISSSTKDRPTR